MSAKTFADLVDTTPSVATKLIHRFCHIIRVSDDRIMDVSTMRSVQRVCQELMRLSGGTVIHPLPAQGEIAGLASTMRETVGRVFHELTAAGIIEHKQRALYIRDRARLERLIGNLDLEETFDTVFHPKSRSGSAYGFRWRHSFALRTFSTLPSRVEWRRFLISKSNRRDPLVWIQQRGGAYEDGF
jgi:hypothetical protein